MCFCWRIDRDGSGPDGGAGPKYRLRKFAVVATLICSPVHSRSPGSTSLTIGTRPVLGYNTQSTTATFSLQILSSQSVESPEARVILCKFGTSTEARPEYELDGAVVM
jgi:hypothetical protein